MRVQIQNDLRSFLQHYSGAVGDITIIFELPPNSDPAKEKAGASTQEFRSCPQPNCAFKTFYDSIYTRHVKTQEINAVPQIKTINPTLPSVVKLPSGQFGCLTCGYTSHRKYNARIHFLGHGDEKPFKCAMCSYRSKRQGDVRVHEWRVHKGRARSGSSLPRESLPLSSHVKQVVGQPLELRPADVKTHEQRMHVNNLGMKNGDQIGPEQDENVIPKPVILTSENSSQHMSKPAPAENI